MHIYTLINILIHSEVKRIFTKNESHLSHTQVSNLYLFRSDLKKIKNRVIYYELNLH